jgi:hypothetical protein
VLGSSFDVNHEDAAKDQDRHRASAVLQKEDSSGKRDKCISSKPSARSQGRHSAVSLMSAGPPGQNFSPAELPTRGIDSTGSDAMISAPSSGAFGADERMYFSKESGTWRFEADDGVEMEYDTSKSAWVPVVSRRSNGMASQH